nr:unnamed protein product [Digitaria exilis]
MLHSASLSSCQPSAISPHSLLSPVFLPPLAGRNRARPAHTPPWISNPLQPRRHNLPSFLLDLPFATLGDRIAGNRRSPNGRPPLTTENHLHVELPSPATISSARPSSPCSIGFRAHFRGSPPADLGAIAAGRDRLVFCIVLDLSLIAGELAVGRNGRSKAALWSYVSVEPDFSPDDPAKDPGSLGSQPGHPPQEQPEQALEEISEELVQGPAEINTEQQTGKPRLGTQPALREGLGPCRVAAEHRATEGAMGLS